MVKDDEIAELELSARELLGLLEKAQTDGHRPNQVVVFERLITTSAWPEQLVGGEQAR